MSAEELPDAEAHRFTYGLLFAVMDAMDAHGYRRGDNQAIGRTLSELLRLTRTYEGRDPDSTAGD